MIIKLTHAQKVALLEAVQSGELDTELFDTRKQERKTPQEIEAEILRLDILDGADILCRRGELMQQYGRGEITKEEYIAAQLALFDKTTTHNHK